MNYENKNPIRLWAEDDRPREKMLHKGKHVLSDAELLAILIGSGTQKKSALDIARDILESSAFDLNRLAKLSLKDLMKFGGIGQARAVTIASAIELGGRRKRAESDFKKITSSALVHSRMESRLADLNHEEFWVILLNRANKVISEHQISAGGISGTVADPRMIFSLAIDAKASGIILCHNHPSGNLSPSEADRSLTRKIKEGALLFDIHLLDHLIITQSAYFSFSDEGIL